ncbi:hypothetical protein ACFQJD_00265 [Haloplanus sp. GCM10025708]|uniref:hypothetical protein n=1 Tax=Haloplanus sp. GCM10025708 TaxID=3252679 RepID=UPI00360916FD
MSTVDDAPPDPELHARMQLEELAERMEEIDWSHVDGISVAEAAAFAERFREAAGQ